MTAARDRLATLLGEVTTPGTFSAQRRTPADDLHLEVRGVGQVLLPVPDEQAELLCQVGRPAQYGQGTQTLLDPRVRDTWEIPTSRVKIDKRAWNKTLRPVLDLLRADFDIPPDCGLEAELHSMLVYARGQFFVPHQDSQKADEMVGSLVVTLPTSFRGGALVVEHKGKTANYRSSSKSLSFVAFYADCRHQIRPVTSGYRIVLTYNLLLRDKMAGAAVPDTAAGSVDELASCLKEHFAAPLPSHRHISGEATTGRPNRLIYLLDHEYTAGGLSWGRLKGSDARRAATLRGAAARADCDIFLALADIHETWSCSDSDWEGPWYTRSRHDQWGDADVDDETDPERYQLEELVDWTTTLDCWVEESGAQSQPILLSVRDHEVCATFPTVSVAPYAWEHEGYMGNYGNTVDRWYRRGALVLWRTEQAFTVRAEASPTWALDTLTKQIRAKDLAAARDMAATLAPFWNTVVRPDAGHRLITKAMRVAHSLNEPAVASILLEPFRVEMLKPGHATPLAALVERYGERWASRLVAVWSVRPPAWSRAGGQARVAWITSLPRLCAVLGASGDAGTTTVRLLLQDSWAWLRGAIGQCDHLLPSHRDEELEKLGRPLAAVIENTMMVGASDIRDEVFGFVGKGDELIACELSTLRAAGSLTPAQRSKAGFDTMARGCAGRLRTRLTRPPRADDDWSIELPGGCSCELCGALGQYLRDPVRRSLEWPLAKDRRRHVHSRLDSGELPVLHQTRRTGSPYTLLLEKTEAVFEREKRARRRDEADLAWLAIEIGWQGT